MKTALALVLVFAGAGLWHFLTVERNQSVTGEAVYVAEGCIHCHSQFSRPESLDTEMYGPETLPEENSGEAVLIGNRRQGPDLSAGGLRRSREWNREHLIDPQLVSPGSRMPRYGHLFEGDGKRGEALLDYLASLGAEKASAWYAGVGAWRLEGEVGSAGRGEELFGRMCQQCHGSTGAGDGILAERFTPGPTNFLAGQFRFAPLAMPKDARAEQLARIVKYGIAGTSMPGHEYLTDGQIADLVAFVSEISVQAELER